MGVDGYVTIGTQLDLSGIKSDLGELKNLVKSGANETTKTIERSTQKMTSTIKSSFSSLKRFLLGLGIVALIRNMFNMGDAVDRVDTLNNYAKVMGNLGISAQDAQKSINILSDKLVGLPTTLDDAALAVQRFTSANDNIEASTEMFLALNNAILAGGANAQIQKSALEQISQAYSKGKPDMMEWRTMLMAMPAQLKQVASAMGFVNAQQLGEAIRSGKVSMDDFMATIVRLNKEGLPGFQSFEEQAKNSTGGIRTSIINLKTAITRGLADIMNAIGQSNIAAFFNNIAKAISRVIPYIAAFVKALMMLFGVKTKKQADNTSTSLDNLGGSGKNVSKGLDSATGSAKSLNKELKGLASFDEMNVLPDKSQSAGGGAGGVGVSGADIGNIDMSGFETSINNVADKVDKIAQKIYKVLKPIFDFIKDNWREIVAGIAAFKFAKLISNLKNVRLALQNIKAVGIGLAIAGIVHTIRKIIDFIHDPSWDNFLGILEGIAVTIIGIALAFGAWPVAVIAALALIVIEIIKHIDGIKEFFIKFVNWIKDGFLMNLKHVFTLVKDIILLPFQVAIEFITSLFTNLYNGIKKIIDGIVDIFHGNFKEGIKKILGGFGDILLAPFRALKDGAKELIDKVIGFVQDLIDWVKDAIGWVKELFTDTGKMSAKIKGNASAGGGKGGGGGGHHGFAKGGIIYSKLPRLASGGIINQPGRGVPLGSAIGGERGMEGVIPLTDSQQMAILGEAIGKYITINANITNEMNGRVISRELQKINNESDFAFNR